MARPPLTWSRGEGRPREHLTHADAQTEMAAGKAVLLDIREPVEWAHHIEGAVQVPRGLLEFAADPTSPRHKPELDPTRRVIVYCRSGVRAALAAATLKDARLPGRRQPRRRHRRLEGRRTAGHRPPRRHVARIRARVTVSGLGSAMQHAQEMLRRLTIGESGQVTTLLGVDHGVPGCRRLDDRTEALLRIGALVALDAPQASYGTASMPPRVPGPSSTTSWPRSWPSPDAVGSVRIVAAAPRIALAAGYDIDAALEQSDPSDRAG